MIEDRLHRCDRILIVDDNEDIHRLMRSILLPPREVRDDRLDELSAALFDESVPTVPREGSRQPAAVSVDSAHQGDDAVRMVREAARSGAPYYLAFVDIRMPPGMDGVKTVKALWEEYPDLYVVICSAYSDYSWQALVEQIGYSPNLLILRKPFDPIEVRQIVASIGKMYGVLERVKSTFADYQKLLDMVADSAASKEVALRALFRDSSDALLLISEDGAIREVNAAAARMLGHREFDGVDVRSVMPLELRTESESESPQRVVARTHAGGEVTLSVTVSRVVDPGVAPYYWCLCRPAQSS